MFNENIKSREWVLEKKVPTESKIKNILNPKWVTIALPMIFVAVCTFVPMISLFKLSVMDKSGFTLKYLTQVFTEKIYLQVIGYTLKTSFLVTLISLLLAYPVAYFIVKLKSPTAKKIILQIILIPFWISLLVRTFSWMVILQDQGIINSLLKSFGLIQKPVHLLYNTTGVLIGMTHILFPYMVLNIYSTMEGIDRQLTQVAEVLGARPTKAFWQIFFPLSIPGVMSGSILVFILALGYFITPTLLGSSKNMMISTLIQNNISSTLNWSLAAALSLVLFIITMILLLGFFLLMKKHPAVEEGL